ncbi:nuclear transport factor 2 family protein [uncultured Croceitalea sp.]|uniref:nuclear transport factor 2 family protein n=1 Tax=uncultured Croceitalea sp. TaxID=1798908 RepID=UPI003305EBFF
MKYSISLFVIFLLGTTVFSQSETEVYLFDLETADGKIQLANPKNISNNKGYDNQPSFLDDRTVLFSSTRASQTDVLQFNIEDGSSKKWLTDTATGSEYSPLKIPGKNAISAIRLDLDGLQRLYSYSLKNGKSKVLLEGLKVGYHLWYDKNTIVCTVLKENQMDLVVANLEDGSTHTMQKNVGRSLHKIPNSNLVSYISKEDERWQIKSLDPLSGSTQKIFNTYGNTEDMCWLKDGTLLAGADKAIVMVDPDKDEWWQQLMFFPQEEIHGISRIAVNSTGTRLVFVAEASPRAIVQQQLDAYNNRDIEGFLSTYSDDVELFNHPNKPIGKGKTKMREMYEGFFANTPDLNCEIKNRIVLGNRVIDEEFLTINGQNYSAVAIYEVKNGKIAKVTFIQ